MLGCTPCKATRDWAAACSTWAQCPALAHSKMRAWFNMVLRRLRKKEKREGCADAQWRMICT
ncbi:hypothetical protein D3C72_2435860 [compost metagenome]